MPAGSKELKRLAERKAAIQCRIARARSECIEAGRGLEPKLRIVDAVWSNWRLVSPLIGIGGAAVGLFRRRKVTLVERVSGIVRWAPLVLRTVRAVADARRA